MIPVAKRARLAAMLPLLPAGLGHGRGAHAPDEIYLVEPREGVPVAGLAEVEKAYADVLYALGAP